MPYFEIELEAKKIIVQSEDNKSAESSAWHDIICNTEDIIKIKKITEVSEEYAYSH